jgi:hypothetical protein
MDTFCCSERPLQPIMAFEQFMKSGLDFMGPITLATKSIGNQYILVVINHTTKWGEAKALKDNIVQSTIKFIYENIITCFGCLIHLVNDQGTHLINRTIEILIQEFMITHHKSTTYYPQGNGQTKSTNKTLGRLLAKMVNVNQNDCDVMLFTTLRAYQTTYKVTTQATPFELVYGIQHVMPIEFMVPTHRI